MNRAGVSLLRDRGPAAWAQDEMGWPPFLMRKGFSYTPTVPSDSPERTSVGAPDLCPHPPFIHPFILIPGSLLLTLNLLLLLH